MWSALREEIAGSFVCGAVMIAVVPLALVGAGEQAKASRHFEFRRGERLRSKRWGLGRSPNVKG